jgi:TPR repeat protein
MPVSYLPCVFPLLLVAIPLLCLLKGKKTFLLALAGSIVVLVLLLLPGYIRGRILTPKAESGDAASQYELARWHENHCQIIQDWFYWPCEPEVLTGYAWLEKSAQQDYPPAVYTLGIRFKYGQFVPRPPNWTGSDGVFPQPERGQALIDRAIQLGYKPRTKEEWHYFSEYRNNSWTP